jgi:aminomethyltransferase
LLGCDSVVLDSGDDKDDPHLEPSAGVLRKTPLNAVHRESGAKMVSFGGWEMPVEYAGLIREHMAVREAAGLFDVSHMGQIEVEGRGALSFLQRVTSNNLAKTVVGQAQYTCLPLPNGAPVDDLVALRLAEERFLLVVNAANTRKDFEWLERQGPEGCRVRDRSDEYALVALQGPRAQQILSPHASVDLASLAFYHCAEGDVLGFPALVSRTGYTGEDGFEILVANEGAEPLWRGLLAAGAELGLVAVGLGARDTLRLEAKMCLYGQDIDETTTLVEAGLGWVVSLDEVKGDYIGRAVLEEQKKHGAPRKLVGFEMVGRGIARHGYPSYLGDRAVGAVTSGSYAPFLKKNIGLCYLPTPRAAVGTAFEIEVRGHRLPAQVVPTPFYKRPR